MSFYPYTAETRQIPSRLYRYRPLTGEPHYLEWVEQILTKSTLYFTSPKYFNDPFDCRCVFAPSSRVDLRRVTEELYKKNLPNVTRRQRKEASGKITRANKDKLQKDIEGDMQNSIYEAKVLSLSSARDSVTMWSHYASAHAGICLGFDTSNIFFGRSMPIYYSNEYPSIDIPETIYGKGEFMLAFMLTKAACWRYEDEWRIVHTQHGHGLKQFPSSALSEVIFGISMKEDHKEIITRLLQNRTPKVPLVLQARRGKGYVLEFDKVDL